MNKRIKQLMKKRTIVIAAVILVMVACRKSPATAPSVPPNTSVRIMVLQPSPYEPAVDLFSVSADTFKINTTPVAYPGMRSYMPAPSGIRWLYVRESESFAVFHTGPVNFKPGASYTIQSAYYPLYPPSPHEDDLSLPPDGYARIRVIQGAIYGRLLDCLARDGDTLAKRLNYLDIADFKPVKAGSYTFDLRDSDTPNTYKTSLQATLEAGKIYTILAKTLPVPDTSRIVVGMDLINNN
jgi:hypothetical protein